MSEWRKRDGNLYYMLSVGPFVLYVDWWEKGHWAWQVGFVDGHGGAVLASGSAPTSMDAMAAADEALVETLEAWLRAAKGK